ncbi:MetQ/NlpA family ABC transporter substrate-binding protein [Paenibacillus caui]|uniref:MetQ/NlpA family ABC transporter substrate-binding protein n=1 Tax=Paenibacillus caui TaxID=2873927 RepID=UPI001CA82994|nr:MetQ/NlpA family ABC transporter substrate-binding protein [Paenibacillus caui]
MKKWLKASLLLAIVAVLLAACGGKGASGGDSKNIKIGATVGPYSDMVNQAIKPLLEKKGYKIEVVEFNDYIQPNKNLANKSLDANLFQHIVYMKKFAEDNKMDLTALISVPTAPMGIYSKKFTSIDQIADGSTIAVANDPTNLARTLGLLQDAGLVKVNPNIDPATASEKDVTDNPHNFKIEPIEGAQLARTLDSADVVAIPGNFALAAKLDLTTALKLENMPENYRNQVVVRTDEADSQLAKDLKEVVESADFEKVIDDKFKGFSKPDWMKNR